LHETVTSFRALGFNSLIALSSALAFHVLHVSYPTSPSWIPDPRFPVYVKNIHWAKHGSDTETFDTEGRFVPEKFEEIFSKYDRWVHGPYHAQE
jgi:peroxygenase